MARHWCDNVWVGILVLFSQVVVFGPHFSMLFLSLST